MKNVLAKIAFWSLKSYRNPTLLEFQASFTGMLATFTGSLATFTGNVVDVTGNFVEFIRLFGPRYWSFRPTLLDFRELYWYFRSHGPQFYLIFRSWGHNLSGCWLLAVVSHWQLALLACSLVVGCCFYSFVCLLAVGPTKTMWLPLSRHQIMWSL